MAIAKIRIGNRVTIPPGVMQKKNLHVGDEVYFEIYGVMGRDVFLSGTVSSGNAYGVRTVMPIYLMATDIPNMLGSSTLPMWAFAPPEGKPHTPYDATIEPSGGVP